MLCVNSMNLCVSNSDASRLSPNQLVLPLIYTNVEEYNFMILTDSYHFAGHLNSHRLPTPTVALPTDKCLSSTCTDEMVN